MNLFGFKELFNMYVLKVTLSQLLKRNKQIKFTHENFDTVSKWLHKNCYTDFLSLKQVRKRCMCFLEDRLIRVRQRKAGHLRYGREQEIHHNQIILIVEVPQASHLPNLKGNLHIFQIHRLLFFNSSLLTYFIIYLFFLLVLTCSLSFIFLSCSPALCCAPGMEEGFKLPSYRR